MPLAGNQSTEEGAFAMSIESRLKKILGMFGDPVENGAYHGKATRYWTFNISTHGANFADDMPQDEICLVQIHLFAPRTFNHLNYIRAAKVALANDGFIWPEVTDLSDDEGRHIVLETARVQEDDDG